MIIKALDYLTPIFLIGVGVYLLIKNESTASSLMVIAGGVICLALAIYRNNSKNKG
ncbi:putative membrane protein [Caldibacillus thermoamylovorans]|jgi:L-asparagine transporter-like permease|uniref:Putative membrane protein n=1 Tax=Caldibacillus thermoamylovorans TaxID=35841 RepID=A0A090KNB7_9BACI|nr:MULTISPECIES: hypothetical protein [Bacillaceae]MCM3477914.1 hypothetical protein [Caldibacillus thermoamylovorans]MED4853304.1 hypothetical protein [Caldifermentibacillus hisashii]CEE00179.1 putative membrane protein [Caldibacillus thermoamylovorans]